MRKSSIGKIKEAIQAISQLKENERDGIFLYLQKKEKIKELRDIEQRLKEFKNLNLILRIKKEYSDYNMSSDAIAFDCLKHQKRQIHKSLQMINTEFKRKL